MTVKMLRMLGIAAIGAFLVLIVSCSDKEPENGTETEKSTKSVSDKVDLSFDGLAYGANLLPEGKVFKKASPEDFASNFKTPHEGIYFVAKFFGGEKNMRECYTGLIVDGNLLVSPDDRKYNIMGFERYTSKYVFPGAYNAKGDTLKGVIDVKTGKEVLECKYKKVFYDDETGNIYYTTFDGFKGSVFKDGTPTGALIDPQGNSASFNTAKNYEAYQDGDKWGVKVDGKNKFPANKYNFLSLEKVPGMTWHFVCRSKMDNGEIKCGIVSFALNTPSIVVRRIYDDYEFLGRNGNYASNAVRFYDATHLKNTLPLVLNCNGEEAGTKVDDNFHKKNIDEWMRKHYGKDWVD